MAEETNTPNNEELDLAKVQDFIKGQVETFAKEVFEKQAPQVQPQGQQQLTQEELARRQLADIITPFVKPGMDAVQLAAADTRDYVDFYQDASIDQSDKDAVEKMFNELKQAGRPLPRRDIYDYLQGKMSREKPEEFSKKITERQKRQLDKAQGATDFGFGAIERAKNDPVYSNIKNMSLDELEKALDGVTF
jgi:hypothetical protein